MALRSTFLKGKNFLSLLFALVTMTYVSAQTDVTRPTVVSVSPGNWSITINSGVTVSAVFSEAMNAGTITGSTFELRNVFTNALVPGTVTYNASTRTATLYPASRLDNSLLYSATVKGGTTGVKDVAGNYMLSDYTWYFIMIPLIDLTAPTVLSVTPPNNSTGVSANTNVTAMLSEEMTVSTINTSTVELRNAANVLIPATVSYNTSTRVITLDPASALPLGAVYKAKIKGGSAGVKDKSGNPLPSDYNWQFSTSTTGDIIPPTITSISPANGVTAVSVNATVSAVFSELMTASTISGSTFQLKNPAGTLVPAVVTYNATTKTATLTPSAALTGSTVYTATVTGGVSGVKDAAGNAMVNTYTWSFTTADVTPPTITSVSPANGATGVAVNTTVSAVFNEEMSAASITGSTFQLKNSSNALITAVVSYNAATRTATLTPSAALAGSAVYTATIIGGASGVKDVSGNALVSTYSWSFTTIDNLPPTITSVSPAGGASGVAVNTSVSATFSEAMNAATISGTTFQLKNSSGVLVSAVVSYNATTRTATLTPSAALASSTVYIAAVTGGLTGVKDAAGNAMVSTYTWYFITGAPVDNTPPTITSVSPVNNATGVAINTTVSAVFSEAMNASTISGTTFQLKNSSSVLVSAVVTYNTTTKTATLTPSAALASSTVYTATITGGASGVKDAAGIAMVNNYTWSFTTAAPVDYTPPTITSVAPLNAATGVSSATTVSAVFSEEMNASTVSGSTFELRDASNALVAAAVSYNAATKTVTLTPSALLLRSAVYYATVKGGASGVKDAAGNAMVNNYNWSFTIGSSIFDPAELPVYPDHIDQPVEVGFRFRSTVSGKITGLRFYKGAGNTGAHIGHLWNNTGTMMGEITFTNETASGWQQVMFASPISINANQTYVASYYSVAGIYAYTNNYFTQAYSNGSLIALQDGTEGANGIYKYSAGSIFPTDTYLSTNYFVDVVFGADLVADNTPPTITSVSPANNATNVNVNSPAPAVFSEPMTPSTITTSNFELRTSGGTLVPATIAYNASSMTATLIPSAPLSYLSDYTAKVKGGTSGVKDAAGNALVNDYTWTFKTGEAPYIAPTEGPGGPILVISTSANPFSRYAVEILRAEGLNEFAAADMSTVNSAMLNNYDVVVLGEMTVTADQVTMLTAWVNAGGTLIAFKPSSLLAPLMGILPATTTLNDKYLLVNNAGPGAGIVNQTIQFHGSANQHVLSGATAIATLCSNATTPTIYPAVTMMNVGLSGGRAVAFAYDLAKSVVYTRQGNPAWAGQKRDGQIDPIRSDDMFFPDWIDFNKIAIPQADEQQRLLANIILQSNLHRKPLPRFWYLPRDLKAAIVMTGDDHANGGTEGRFNQYKTLGPNTAQDITDWKAVRGTSYMYPGSPLTNASAVSLQSQGFEIALHPTTNCLNFTASSLNTDFTNQLGQFTSAYPGVSSPATNRTHCLVWSDWATQPKTELQKGMRLDVTYYYWPEAWMQNRPGMFTGSGMPMRFADLDGSLIDVYQAPTQMTDETNMDYTTFCNTVLDKAVGPEGYYGVFTTNMHTDNASSAGSDAIIASAQARQIPVISAKQMLTWLDERNNSSFGNMTWNNNQLTFTVAMRNNANNLKAMLPLYSATGQLVSITRNGNAVPFTTQTIKGMQYAFFAPVSGSNVYVATYGGNTRIAEPVTTIPVEPVITTPVAENKADQEKIKQAQSLLGKLYVNVMPNPSTTYFNLVISSNDANPVTVRVTDMFGRVIETHEKVTATGILRLGESWRGGTYFVEVLQGEQRKVIKMMKVN